SPPVVEREEGELADWEILLELSERLGGGPMGEPWLDRPLRWLRPLGVRWTPTGFLNLLLRLGPYGDRFLPWSDGLSLERLKAAPMAAECASRSPMRCAPGWSACRTGGAMRAAFRGRRWPAAIRAYRSTTGSTTRWSSRSSASRSSTGCQCVSGRRLGRPERLGEHRPARRRQAQSPVGAIRKRHHRRHLAQRARETGRILSVALWSMRAVLGPRLPPSGGAASVPPRTRRR